MIEESGRSVTELRASFRPTPLPYPTLKLGLDPGRDVLSARIAARTAQMLDGGIIEETAALLNEGFRAWPALASVGYREVIGYLDGAVARADLAALISLKTLQLAKRQRTWFKRDPDIHWLDPARAVDQARDLIPRPS